MSATLEFFRKCKEGRGLYIETGAYEGDSLELARQLGFPRMISIELDPVCAEFCRHRFDGDRRITIIQGDSGDKLKEVLRDSLEPALFWLDAHAVGPNRAGQACPLRRELATIERYAIKGDRILIDDVRELELMGTSLPEVMRLLPRGCIHWRDTGDPRYPDDVLVVDL